MKKLDVSYTTTITGKSLISETNNDNFVGVYAGKSSPKTTLEAIHKSDLIVMFGYHFVDNDLLGMTREDLSGKRIIHISRNSVRADRNYFPSVTLKDVMDHLLKRMDEMKPSKPFEKFSFEQQMSSFESKSAPFLTYDSVITHIHKSKLINKNSVIIETLLYQCSHCLASLLNKINSFLKSDGEPKVIQFLLQLELIAELREKCVHLYSLEMEDFKE